MDPDLVDLTKGEDSDVLMDEVEFMTTEGPSTSGRTENNQRRYRPPQGPRGPPPYPTYDKSVTKPPGNFWWNRKYHRNADVPTIDEANPLVGLEYCLTDIADFIASQDGLLLNLNLVAERIYNLGANRPCADEFCQYGRAARPVIPEPKELRIQDVSVSLKDAATSTPRYQDLMNGEAQFCLPTLIQGRKLAPTKKTPWSSGMDPKNLALAHASRGGVPGKDAVKAAKFTEKAVRKARIRSDPKLKSEVQVALDQILARKKTVDASTNTRRRSTVTRGTTRDGTSPVKKAPVESRETQCNFPPPRPPTTDAETSTDTPSTSSSSNFDVQPPCSNRRLPHKLVLLPCHQSRSHRELMFLLGNQRRPHHKVTFLPTPTFSIPLPMPGETRSPKPCTDVTHPELP